jgi:dipeptidyl aminopeptidase/acylaminoacyl peptidase
MSLKSAFFPSILGLSLIGSSCGQSPSQTLIALPNGVESPSTVHYGNKTIDLERFVTSFFRGMVDPVTEDVYWIKSAVNGETLLREPGNTQGLPQSLPILDYGKRAFSTPFYHALTKSFYFISDTKNAEDFNLHHFDPQNPIVTKLTSHVVVRSVSSLPTQDQLFMIYRDGPSGSPVCIGSISATEPRKEKQVYCDGGHAAEYTIYDYTPLHMSPDGLRAALVLNRNNDRADAHLGILDLTTGQLTLATNYPKEKKRNKVFAFAWKGDKLYFLEQNSEREALVAFDTQTKEMTELDQLPGKAPEAGRDAIYEPGTGYFVYQEHSGQGSALRIFDPAQNRVLARIPLTDHNLYSQPFVVTNTGKVILSGSSKTKPGNVLLSLVPGEGENAKISTFFEPSAGTAFEQPCPSETVYYPTFDQGPDGSQRLIEGILFHPVDGRKPTAALIYAHGGPTGRTTTAWALESQMYCHLGYAVFAPNPRGSSGFGKEFEDLNNYDWGGGDFKDYEYGRQYLAKRFGIPDSRIGIYGESYGGYMTNVAVTRPDSQFAFGMSLMGIADLSTTVRDSVVGQFLRGEIGDPETHAEFYRERSPIFYAENMRVPLLLVHGASDNRVPTKESQRLYARLMELGKDVKYVELEDEGHGFKYMSTIKVFMQSALDFLNRVAPVD